MLILGSIKMNGLLFLMSEDFHIQKGTKGNILCHKIPGFSLLLFYSTKCIHCQELVPVFKKLPGTIDGCQFGMINVSQNKRCVLMSRETIASIDVVPYIILYCNGKPFMRYQGPYDSNEISRFVIEVTKAIKNKQKLSTEVVKQPKEGNKIPEYTIGKPLYGQNSKICYLEFDGAYLSTTDSSKLSAADFKARNEKLLSQSGMTRRR